MSFDIFVPSPKKDRGQQREIEHEYLKDVAETERLFAREMERDDQAPLPKPSEWQPAKGKDPFATVFDRRAFLRGGAAALGALALAYPLQEFMAREAFGAEIASPYGDPVPTADLATGLRLIALPPGFRYCSYGWTGDPISPLYPGIFTPPLHDGMAVLRQVGSRVILCRNHEQAAGTPFFTGPITYSNGAGGGNTNLIFNTLTGQFEKAWPTLAGTVRNCAGGLTPFASWLSCEETFSNTGAFTHGWCFDVPALGVATAQPLKAMGRFNHEAVAVDPATGVVYETEDNGSASGFYRFIPSKPGNYAAGGVLQMAKVKGVNQKDLRGAGQGGPAVAVGSVFDIEWVTIDDPENLGTVSVFDQGYTKGGIRFRRLEGCWYSAGAIHFLSTDGGAVSEGTVYRFDIAKQTLTVVFDTISFAEVDNPDNMTVTPQGAYLLCEDNAGGQGAFQYKGVDSERLVGLTPAGQTFTFAVNLIDFRPGIYMRPGNPVAFTGNQRSNEWAGACFSPDGKWLFVNIQTPGITFAITGPWKRGPL